MRPVRCVQIECGGIRGLGLLLNSFAVSAFPSKPDAKQTWPADPYRTLICALVERSDAAEQSEQNA